MVTFTRLRSARRFIEANVVFVPVYIRRPYDVVKLYFALKALHLEQPIDVIATQTIYEDALIAWVFGKWYGISVIGQVHYDIFSPAARHEQLGRRLVARLRRTLGRRLLRHLYAVRVVGKSIKERLLNEQLHSSVHLIPVPVTMRTDLNPGSLGTVETPRVLFVGRLAPEKNLADWLRVAAAVAARNPTVEFEIAGDGPLRQELGTLATQIGIAPRVHFHGAVPYDRLSEIYQSATVFLLTSRYEGFARVLVEAYLHGIPVVATRITGVEDVVEHGKTGYLHVGGDLEGMADSVLKLLADNQLRHEMGTRGYDIVRRRFDPRTLTREWVSLLVSGASPRTSSLLPPLRATWPRWKRVSRAQYSVLRGLEYERLDGLELRGRTLDLGGGQRNSYYHLLRIRGRIDSVNMDLTARPTVLANLNTVLPFASESVDNVITFNTLEHVRNDVGAVRELLRVLKPAGHFHIIVPFLYRVHGSPNDYHRHTASWWEELFLAAGLKEGSFTIEPLVWDRAASAFSLLEFGWLRGLRKKLVMLRAPVSHARWRGRERVPEGPVSRALTEHTLGYYIHGIK